MGLATGWMGSQNALMGIVFVSRLLPFLSFDIVSYGAGLTTLSAWRFALATLAGLGLVQADGPPPQTRRGFLTKSALAQRMGTSRASLNRLLDPNHPSVTLLTLEKAASALGLKLRIALE